jgi:hypothetical protein
MKKFPIWWKILTKPPRLRYTRGRPLVLGLRGIEHSGETLLTECLKMTIEQSTNCEVDSRTKYKQWSWQSSCRMKLSAFSVQCTALTVYTVNAGGQCKRFVLTQFCFIKCNIGAGTDQPAILYWPVFYLERVRSLYLEFKRVLLFWLLANWSWFL